MSDCVVALLATLAVAAALPPRFGPVPIVRVPRVSRVRRGARELEWVEALAAEVRAGRDPVAALIAASSAVEGVSPKAYVAARTGSDVASALDADGLDSPLVRGVAACWRVASGSGAGLAASLVTLADAAREAERLRRELRAGLSEPRATAVVLAALPVVGLVLGALLGARPLAWLVGGMPGLVVLGLGLALEVLGATWAWRIIHGLERQL